MIFSYMVDSYRDTNIFRIDLNKFDDMLGEMAYDSKWRNIFDYLSQQINTQLSIRDFLEGEKAIQTLHAAYISISNYFVAKTEQERNFGYTDLILEPNLANFPDMKFKYIIEFKYINHSVKNDTKEYATQLDTKRNDAISQLRNYAQDKRYKSNSVMKDTTKLKLVYVIYHGWEMVECESVFF